MISPAVFLDGRVSLYAGDCREALRELPDNHFDSVVTDPPYHLSSIVKRFGAETSAECRDYEGGTGTYKRASRGFMGKQWDGGDIAFRVELWREVFRVLKPGGHCVAFSGTRTYHRMACAIEDAGFEIRDLIAWMYGTGFPKSHDVSKGIDKAAGAQREVVAVGAAVKRMIPGADQHRQGWEKNDGREFRPEITRAATEAAAKWEGWGTALKPALEPICFARKPLAEGTVAANVLRWGTGALNIDATRVAGETPSVERREAAKKSGNFGRLGDKTNGDQGKLRANGNREEGLANYLNGKEGDALGRWPANLVHDGSPEVVAAFPDSAGQNGIVDGQTSARNGLSFGLNKPRSRHEPRGDSGSAARFFASFPQRNEPRCCLCGLLSDNHNATKQTCDAIIVASSLPTLSTRTESSVPASAPEPRAPENVGKINPSRSHASNAEGRSSVCRQQSGVSAPENARPPLLSKIVQNAKSAADLCDSCATAIAQSLVAMRQGLDPASPLCQVSISEPSRQILTRNLVLYAEGRESTDTITTTQSLKTLFGSVFHAIAASTNQERAESAGNIEPDQKRLFYSSKADGDDRLGSKHPTVKPVDLMQWLVRLVTPPGGCVLDPFAGTGTTGEAAWREGCSAVLIEREAEYQADVVRRMRLALSGRMERRSETARARARTESPGPLFSEPSR